MTPSLLTHSGTSWVLYVKAVSAQGDKDALLGVLLRALWFWLRSGSGLNYFEDRVQGVFVLRSHPVSVGLFEGFAH